MRIKHFTVSDVLSLLNTLIGPVAWAVGVYAIACLFGGTVLAFVCAVLMLWVLPKVSCAVAMYAALSVLNGPFWATIALFAWPVVFGLFVAHGVVTRETYISKNGLSA